MAKYCEEIVKKIEGMLAIGVSNKSCAEAVGISCETFYEWTKNNPFDIGICGCSKKAWENDFPEDKICPKCKEEIEIKPGFSYRIKTAKALGQVKLLKVIDEAAPTSWQAAAWKLERIWHDEFGKKLEVLGNKDKPLELEIRDFKNASKEELMKVAGLTDNEKK